MALQMLYQRDMGGEPPVQEIVRRFDRAEYLAGAHDGEVQQAHSRERPSAGAMDSLRREVERAFEYAHGLVSGTVEHLEEIDGLIAKQADNWRLERMPAVDRNILRLAVFELLYEEEIPKLVVVDEAIELAKRFSTDQSSGFVNGLLDGLLKRRQFPGRMT